jgi:hypothetical protein
MTCTVVVRGAVHHWATPALIKHALAASGWQGRE